VFFNNSVLYFFNQYLVNGAFIKWQVVGWKRGQAKISKRKAQGSRRKGKKHGAEKLSSHRASRHMPSASVGHYATLSFVVGGLSFLPQKKSIQLT
jgi:hypothetical protein